MEKTYFSLDEYKKFVRDVNNIVGASNLRGFHFDKSTGFIKLEAISYMNLLTAISTDHIDVAIELLGLIKTVPHYNDDQTFINLYAPPLRADADKFLIPRSKEKEIGKCFPVIAMSVSDAYAKIEKLDEDFMNFDTHVFDEVFIPSTGAWYTVDKLKSFFLEKTND